MLADDTNGPVSYFVYYRIHANADRNDARRRIAEMQQRLAESLGLTCRLLHRRDDDRTWMEVYEAVTDTNAFELALQQEVDTANVQSLIEPGSARHIERFVQCA